MMGSKNCSNWLKRRGRGMNKSGRDAMHGVYHYGTLFIIFDCRMSDFKKEHNGTGDLDFERCANFELTAIIIQ